MAILLGANLAHASEWLTDYDHALAQARQENKAVLAYFTGSDWCIWCKRLDTEVLSKEAFENWAAARVVLLKLDFPRAKLLKKSVLETNQALMQRYGIQGFPTILILDANGSEKARTGYRQGGQDAYIQHLESLL